MVLRVLYRLRTLSEQSPFDAATYAYMTPLVTTIIEKAAATGKGSDSEELTEQLALVSLPLSHAAPSPCRRS